jgi:hypothetical protein
MSAWDAPTWSEPTWSEPPTDAELYGLCPDPYAGPPDGPDAWLADLSGPELHALADELAAAAGLPSTAGPTSSTRPTPATGLPAATGPTSAPGPTTAARPGAAAAPMPAGFTHRDPAPGAAGFAAGGPLDLLAPDPVLAGFAQDAVDDGLGQLSDDELVGLLCAARRLSSWQAAVELAAVSELDSRRLAQSEQPRGSRASEHISEELAAALTLTGRAADALLGLARSLSRLPAVLAALTAGVIDRPRAEVFASELAVLDDISAAAVAAAFWRAAADLTTGQLRAALRSMVLAIDPDASRRRAATARDDARIETWQENSGNGAIGGRELPPAEVIAADQRIDAIARTLRSSGAPGTLDQLRAAVFTALLLGRDPAAGLLPATRHADGAGQDPANSRNTTGNQAAAHAPNTTTGNQAAAHAPNTTADPATPNWWAGLAGSINLTMPAAAWLRLSDAPGEAAGLGPLDAWTCRDLASLLAQAGRARWCVTLTGPGGRAVAHACARAGPGPGPPDNSDRPGNSDPPGKSGLPDQAERSRAAWLASLKFSWLERGTCSHQRQAGAYRPSAALRHLIEIRQRTCSFPGCRRQARRCDIDHTTPFDQGGRTCECNCAPLCRQHHQAKQAAGWQLAQPEPGVLIWTMPHGRSYTVQPDSYTG